MSNGKFTPVLIGVICLVVVALIIFSISLFKGKTNIDDNPAEGSVQAVAPVLELSLSTTEEEQDSVIITATATTEDELGIDYIILPDGSKVNTDNKEYEVTENGNYKFQVFGKNGASDTLSIDVTNIRQINSDNPYVPEGFEYIGGEPNEGFVIQDGYGNQYVWVPVPTGVLTRSTLMNSEYEESNSSATNLVNSVAKNYGFYIARFEASSYDVNGTAVAASVAGQIPWTNITYQDAYTASSAVAEAFGYVDVATNLVNSYAWDTTLEWLNKSVTNYSTNTSYGNYSGTIYSTGQTESDQINHICDMAGNVREWTTEIYKASSTTTNKKTTNNKNKELESVNRVVRGGSANINKIANSRNGYPENLTDGYWGFRTILYKIN